MKDLNETAVTVLLAFLGLALTYSLVGDILSDIILKTFEQVGAFRY